MFESDASHEPRRWAGEKAQALVEVVKKFPHAVIGSLRTVKEQSRVISAGLLVVMSLGLLGTQLAPRIEAQIPNLDNPLNALIGANPTEEDDSCSYGPYKAYGHISIPGGKVVKNSEAAQFVENSGGDLHCN